MIKKYIALGFILLTIFKAGAIGDPEKDARMKWWTEAKFGMFIHWGDYSQLAGVYKGHPMNKGGAEWIMNRSKIPVAEYREYAKEFNPVLYDPDSWVKMAKDAGMKYIVITAKHHDGFAMFDTKASDWDIVDATPYGKDVLKPLAEACRKYGIKLGFYYSQANDWVNGGSAARRIAIEGWDNPDSARIDKYTLEHDGYWDPVQLEKPMSEYIDEVAVPQVRELLTNYGEVAVLWWDYPVRMTDEFAEKLQSVLPLQPNIITNDRLKEPNYKGDFRTPEQSVPNLKELKGEYWETCMTMNGTWGYKSYDFKWKSTEWLVCTLVDIVSKGGNFLLNIGPKGNGEFPIESINRLKEIGDWMDLNSEAIYETEASPFGILPWGGCTKKEIDGNTVLYFTLFSWPDKGTLKLPEFKNNVILAELLSSGKKINTKRINGDIIVELPADSKNEIAPVVKIIIDGKLKI